MVPKQRNNVCLIHYVTKSMDDITKMTIILGRDIGNPMHGIKACRLSEMLSFLCTCMYQFITLPRACMM